MAEICQEYGNGFTPVLNKMLYFMTYSANSTEDHLMAEICREYGNGFTPVLNKMLYFMTYFANSSNIISW